MSAEQLSWWQAFVSQTLADSALHKYVSVLELHKQVLHAHLRDTLSTHVGATSEVECVVMFECQWEPTTNQVG